MEKKDMTGQEKRVTAYAIIGSAALLAIGIFSDKRTEEPLPQKAPVVQESREVIRIPDGCPVYTSVFVGKEEAVRHFFLHESHYRAYSDSYKSIRVEIPDFGFREVYTLKEREVKKQPIPRNAGYVELAASKGHDIMVYGIDMSGKETSVYKGRLPPQIKGSGNLRIRTGRDK